MCVHETHGVPPPVPPWPVRDAMRSDSGLLFESVAVTAPVDFSCHGTHPQQ